ncbi:hypothetical protein BDQ17DRAFT_1384902 [Cyathus striatus]|nr:hypothetical protein BDQ17DRAFT_1384902 [Cyathus striatus]
MVADIRPSHPSSQLHCNDDDATHPSHHLIATTMPPHPATLLIPLPSCITMKMTTPHHPAPLISPLSLCRDDEKDNLRWGHFRMWYSNVYRGSHMHSSLY